MTGASGDPSTGTFTPDDADQNSAFRGRENQIAIEAVDGNSGNANPFRDPPRPEVAETIRLGLLPGIGPRTMTLLLQRFGSPRNVFQATSDQLSEVAGVGKKLIHTLHTADHFVDAERVMRWCEENQTDVVVRDSRRYPRLLREIADPPPLLFCQGELTARDERAVAIVGTRHATIYGLKQAEHFAFMLAKAGVTVVSGLARGIDAAAHEGAMHAGGRTIAVLGGGLGRVYPSEHRSLAAEIASHGAVISEYGPEVKPRGGMFPQRNRLISGLSVAVLVVEAPDRSGALITARLAMEQDRDVLAIPGPINSRASRGCNLLIRDGAKLVQNIDDVLEEIGPTGWEDPKGSSTDQQAEAGSEHCGDIAIHLTDTERAVLHATHCEAIPIDRVITSTNLPASEVLAALTGLELKRLVKRQAGRVHRTNPGSSNATHVK